MKKVKEILMNEIYSEMMGNIRRIRRLNRAGFWTKLCNNPDMVESEQVQDEAIRLHYMGALAAIDLYEQMKDNDKIKHILYVCVVNQNIRSKLDMMGLTDDKLWDATNIDYTSRRLFDDVKEIVNKLYPIYGTVIQVDEARDHFTDGMIYGFWLIAKYASNRSDFFMDKTVGVKISSINDISSVDDLYVIFEQTNQIEL